MPCAPRFKKAYLEITNICNKSCEFCVRTSRAPRFMPVDEAARCLAQLSRVTSHVYLHLLGEPLLHPGLFDILAVCDGLKLKAHIATNASLLPLHAPKLAAAPALARVMVSLHDAGSIAEGRAAIDAALTLHSLSGGGKNIHLRMWRGGGALITGLTDYISHVFKVKTPLTGEPTRRGIALARGVFLHVAPPFEWPSMSGDFVSDTGFCLGLRDQIGVLCDGTVVPCCLDSEGAAALGNLLECDIESIASSHAALEIYDGFSRRVAAHPLCKRCSFRTRFGL